eukprot:12015980-Alexandrium_andersonii.AAC.2
MALQSLQSQASASQLLHAEPPQPSLAASLGLERLVGRDLQLNVEWVGAVALCALGELHAASHEVPGGLEGIRHLALAQLLVRPVDGRVLLSAAP